MFLPSGKSNVIESDDIKKTLTSLAPMRVFFIDIVQTYGFTASPANSTSG